MSLVGTRPILQDELQKYELHHRARIAIKPGITGMWQVSGRSDITDFEEVVRLDQKRICQNLFCFFVILFAHSDSHGNGTSDSYQGAKRSEKCNDRTAYACTCKSQCAIFGNMSDIHPVNNTVKYIDKLRGHRRDGKLEHQSAYGCLAKICCCVHFNFPHPFDRDCRTCMCSSPCILIIVNFNRYGQKKL